MRLDETAHKFLRRWNGEISLGLVYSKGNNSTQNTFGFEVEHRRERWGAAAAFNSNLSSSSGVKHLHQKPDRSRWVTIFCPGRTTIYGGIGSFLQSSVQDIHLQSTIGGGIGRYFKNTNRARISVLGGLAWQSANYNQDKVADR